MFRWAVVVIMMLLLPTSWSSPTRTLAVVMAFQRPNETATILDAVLEQGLNILLTQSCSNRRAINVITMRAVLASKVRRVVDGDIARRDEVVACFSEHGCAVHSTSLANASEAQYLPRGTALGKLESLRNLLRGVSLALRDPGVKHVLVAEDDSLLSKDAVSGLMASQSLVMSPAWHPVGQLAPQQVSLVAAQALLRPGLLRDLEDWRDASYGHEVEAAEAEWGREGGQWASTRPSRQADAVPLAARIDVHTGTARTIIRTFLWLADRTLAGRLVATLQGQLATLRSPVAAERGMGGLQHWCTWCRPLCYDHALEALVHGQLFAAFAVPRAAAPVNLGASGPTSASDAARREFRGRPVPRRAWTATFDQGRAAMRASVRRFGWAAAMWDPQPRPSADSPTSPHTRHLEATAARTPGSPGILTLHPAVVLGLRHPTILLVVTAVLLAVAIVLTACRP